MPSLKVDGGTKDVQTRGKTRDTLYLQPEDYARADDDQHANKDYSLDKIVVDPFITMMCACRNYGIMVFLIALSAIRRDDGTVVLDVDNSNLELFAALFALLPRYDAATTKRAKGTIKRHLVERAIQASKESRDAQEGRTSKFPAFIAPGENTIHKVLHSAVVPNYGSTKTLADISSGNGERVECVQFDYDAGHGTVLTKNPPAVIFADSYEIIYKGKEEATPSHVLDLIAGSINDGAHIVSDRKPNLVKCVRSAVALFAAVAAFLPGKFAPLARLRAFGDSEIVFGCGPGDWDVRIVVYRLYCWLVFLALDYGLRYVVPGQLRARDAAEQAVDYWGLPSKRVPLQAQLTKLLPVGRLDPDARRKVVELIASGISTSTDAAALLKTVETDESLRVVGLYVQKELQELGAAALLVVEPRVRTIAGNQRYEESVFFSKTNSAAKLSDKIQLSSGALTFAAVSEQLKARKAAAARVEAASLPVQLKLALGRVVEKAVGEKAFVADIRRSISEDDVFCRAFPMEADELVHGGRHSANARGRVRSMLADLLRASGPGMDLSPQRLLDYRIKPSGESLPQLVPPPAAAGAEGSVPTTARAPRSRSEASPLPPLKRPQRGSKSKKPSQKKKK